MPVLRGTGDRQECLSYGRWGTSEPGFSGFLGLGGLGSGLGSHSRSGRGQAFTGMTWSGIWIGMPTAERGGGKDASREISSALYWEGSLAGMPNLVC
jgi:hypothetical protein